MGGPAVRCLCQVYRETGGGPSTDRPDFQARFGPEDARWNAEQQAVAVGVEIGEYRGVVWVMRRVFQRLLPEQPTPGQRVINNIGKNARIQATQPLFEVENLGRGAEPKCIARLATTSRC